MAAIKYTPNTNTNTNLSTNTNMNICPDWAIMRAAQCGCNTIHPKEMQVVLRHVKIWPTLPNVKYVQSDCFVQIRLMHWLQWCSSKIGPTWPGMSINYSSITTHPVHSAFIFRKKMPPLKWQKLLKPKHTHTHLPTISLYSFVLLTKYRSSIKCHRNIYIARTQVTPLVNTMLRELLPWCGYLHTM